jgi:hypothetical protein
MIRRTHSLGLAVPATMWEIVLTKADIPPTAKGNAKTKRNAPASLVLRSNPD